MSVAESKVLRAREKIVIGITGMPGSGKSTAAKVASEMGYPTVVMGDFVRDEAKRRGLEPTAENLGNLMFQMRKEMGDKVVAKRIVEAVRGLHSPVVLVDGVRSLREVEEFKENFRNFKLIAVHAPPKLRFKRIFRRYRADDTKQWGRFMERDLRELKVGVGEAIALSDMVVQDTGSLEELKAGIRRILVMLTR